MSELDPEAEQQFLDHFKKSAKSTGEFRGSNDIASFHRKLRASLAQAYVPRPWTMRLAILFYRSKLRAHEKRLATMTNLSEDDLRAEIEHAESLRFAVHYSRRANAQQRAWCFQQIKRYRVAPVAAPFLVWHRVVNFKLQKITFGHWDWVLGILAVYPVLVPFIYALLIALSPASPMVRAVFTMAFLSISFSAFVFYKSFTFDVFWVGLRYFKPNGWRYTPL